MKILILGASGMLGNAAFRILSAEPRLTTYGTARSDNIRRHFPSPLQSRLVIGVDVLDIDSLLGIMQRIRPDAILNCIGVIKQLCTAKDPLVALPLNALLPHRLA